MKPESKRVRELFVAAVGKVDPDHWDEFLEEATAGEEDLIREVRLLLEAHQDAGSFLEAPASTPTIAYESTRLVEGPGTVIGAYRLMEQIGEGGMGVVYIAEQSQPVRRKVALKVIKPGMDTKQVIARFEAERQALAMMDHPNIARIFDGGVTESGRPYFVMELVRGVPITEYCDGVRLSIRERLELFVQVCRAVQHAHQKGIIHRDLKPSNILVTLHDGVPVPKVIDFGVAKATGESLTEKTIYTAFTQLVGTPLYMSPEQVELSGLDIDTRSDIYSLGVLLYELLTGTTPFDSEALRKAAFDEMRRIIREDEPPTPSTRLSTLGESLTATSAKRSADPRHLNRSVRGELDWIAMKALEKDRKQRYETANDFAADVVRYLTDQPVEACPPSATYRLQKYARRNQVALTTAALLTTMLVLGTVMSTWQAMRARRAEKNAVAGWAQESQRRQEVEKQRNRAQVAENLARINEEKAKQSEADTKAFSDFLVDDVLTVARPEDVQGGLGIDVTVAQALEAAEANLEVRFAEQPLAEATARDAIGKTWRNLAKYEQAERHLRRAVELREKGLGPDDPATLDSLNSLGVLLSQAGRYAEAIALHEVTVKKRQARLGPDHRCTLTSMNNLSSAYKHAGRDDQALLLFKQTLEMQKAKLGPDDPDTLGTMTLLATAYRDAGHNDQALPLFVEALAKQKAKLGPDNPKTLNTMSNLASAYLDARKFDLALPLFAQALEKQKVRLGLNHPDTLETMFNFGMAYGEAGRLLEAEPLMHASLAGARLKLGPDHPDTQSYLNELARLNWQMGRLKESVSLYEESLRIGQKNKRDDHPVTLITAYNLAVNYRDAGRLAEAEKIIDEWLPRGRAKLGLGNSHTQFGVQTALSIHERMRQPARAEPLYRELAKFWKEQAGAESPQYAGQLAALGLNLLAQQKPELAEPIVRECLLIREKVEPDAWTTFNTKSILGGSLLGQKRYADAEPLLLSSYEGMKQRDETIPPQGKVRLTEAIERLVQLYEATAREDKAAEWRKKLKVAKSAKPAETKQD